METLMVCKTARQMLLVFFHMYTHVRSRYTVFIHRDDAAVVVADQRLGIQPGEAVVARRHHPVGVHTTEQVGNLDTPAVATDYPKTTEDLVVACWGSL